MKSENEKLYQAWLTAMSTLRKQFSEPTYNWFLRPLRPISYSNGIVTVGAPNLFGREWAEQKYPRILAKALSADLGEIPRVIFVLDEPSSHYE